VIVKRGKERGDKTEGYAINRQIKANEVRLIDDTGTNREMVNFESALAEAIEKGMDLVQIGEADSVVIVKMMDFGRFLYEKKKQQGVAKKNQKLVQIKELKLRPRIDLGDYNLRVKKAVEFLNDGKHVKFTLQFRGREIPSMNTLGKELFDRLLKDLEDNNVGPLLSEKESRGGSVWSKVFYKKEKS
jgi:translation initiation factor IF-3